MQRAGSKHASVVTLLAVLWVAPTAHSQVVISEFMADNGGTLLDEDGERSDWIELHNTSGLSVDLAGWRISDQPSALESWIFPPVTLPADGRLVVFASGQDRVGLELHTDFKLSADGEYLSLSPPGGAPPTSEFTPSYPAQLEDVSYGLSASGPLGFLAEHQAWKIQQLRRIIIFGVGALDVAKLALPAFIAHDAKVFVGQRLRAVRDVRLDVAIDPVKQLGEGPAIVHAHAALVAHLEGALEFILKVGTVPITRVARTLRGGLLRPSR